jgi:hypothetical protein
MNSIGKLVAPALMIVGGFVVVMWVWNRWGGGGG